MVIDGLREEVKILEENKKPEQYLEGYGEKEKERDKDSEGNGEKVKDQVTYSEGNGEGEVERDNDWN